MLVVCILLLFFTFSEIWSLVLAQHDFNPVTREVSSRPACVTQ